MGADKNSYVSEPNAIDDYVMTIKNVLHHGGKPGEGTLQALDALGHISLALIRMSKDIRAARADGFDAAVAQLEAMAKEWDEQESNALMDSYQARILRIAVGKLRELAKKERGA